MKMSKEIKLRFYYDKFGTRPMIQCINKNKPIVCAEIGVSGGKNALNMLKHLNIKKLYLIDPYKAFYVKDHLFTQTQMDDLEHDAKDRLSNYNNIVWIKKSSLDAINEIPELDMVYIDGSHKYEDILADIEAYYPIIKKGGTIGGHDFERDGVMRAVSEFANKNKLDITYCKCDWWIKK